MKIYCLALLLCFLQVKLSVSTRLASKEVEIMDIPELQRDENSNPEAEISIVDKRFGRTNTIKVADTVDETEESRQQAYIKEPNSVDFDDITCALCDETKPFHENGVDRQNISSNTSNPRCSTDYQCCEVNTTFADCRNCRLDFIPTQLPPNITVLLLGNNNIGDTSLRPRVFARYPDLKILSLSSNNISSLPNEVFQGLPHLQCLCLDSNTLKMDETLNSSLAFQDLSESLIFLRLNRNNRIITDANLRYPSFALGFLKNLRYLFMDGIPFKRFENPNQKFSNLKSLKLAGFSHGFCNLTGLQKNAFELDSLTHLDISDCMIQGRYVNESAFENLQKLQMLKVTNNFNLGIATVGKFMYGLRNNKNFELLIMQRINPRFTPCIAIYKETLRYFKNTGLKKIYAMDNEIEVIERGALQNLPNTLKFLNLTNNRILFGEYIQDLGNLTGLQTLIVNGSYVPYKFPLVYPTGGLKYCGMQSTISKTVYEEEATPPLLKEEYIKSIPVPPNLSRLSMAYIGMVYTLNNITFAENNLTSADMRGNVFTNLVGPIRGLHKLKSLKLDECYIRDASDKFFDYFPELEHLSFYRNLLGEALSEDVHGNIFKNLKSLKTLNLAVNSIFHLNRPVFKNMSNLKHLYLSRNRLGQVNFTIAHMNQLETLDLKGNQIRTLGPHIRAEINQINKGRAPLKLDLSFNPIGCDCNNLEFLQWLSDSPELMNSSKYRYYCESQYQPDNFKAVIEKLRKQCISHEGLFAIVTCTTVVLMLVILFALAYRFRWTLRYWYHAAKLKVNPQLPDLIFENDVFVSYSNKDDFVEEVLIPRIQNEFNLRVHLHGLHFRAGEQIVDSIHRAVTTSRKTLVVVTKNMLRSYWCNYELMIARREAITRGRQLLVFLFLEPLSSWEVSAEIASYVRESTYIAYPPDPAHRQMFWNKLADDLGANETLR